MQPSFERYKADLKALVARGDMLALAMSIDTDPDGFRAQVQKIKGEKTEEFLKLIPNFRHDYQYWYSESLAVVKQLLPDRTSDFVRYYEYPRNRKEPRADNYTIQDYLHGLTSSYGGQTIVDPSAAVPLFTQQLNILKSVTGRFESTLFDIRQLVQADIFDSEIDAARELAKNKFLRAAGAMAGVVLERHLAQVCGNHGIAIKKKHPTINDLNTLLKDATVIDTPQWRFVQHLADIRNLCDHSKEREPSREEIDDLLAGVEKMTKTLF